MKKSKNKKKYPRYFIPLKERVFAIARLVAYENQTCGTCKVYWENDVMENGTFHNRSCCESIDDCEFFQNRIKEKTWKEIEEAEAALLI